MGVHPKDRADIVRYLEGFRDAGGLPSKYITRVVEKWRISEEDAEEVVSNWLSWNPKY